MSTPPNADLKEEKPRERKDSASTSSSTSNDEEIENMEYLRKYLADKLSLTDTKEKIKVLDNLTLDGIVDYIKANDCKNIITMAGAGISTSAGIPDFRSPGTGLYHNLKKYNLPHPQAIFELDFFSKNPKPFFELAKELYPGTFKPTVCHYFIKLLEEKGMLLRHYTQNIDTLERVAGLSEDKLIEAHGTFHISHCLECRKEYSQDWMKEIIFKDEVPTCEKCNSLVKPDIIFFGETLPHKFHSALINDFLKCDLLIIIGTSLEVQPFASLVDRVKDDVPRLLINRNKVGHKSGIMALLGMSGGLDFDSKDNTRDVCWLGDCDEGCLKLAEVLGWADELKEKVKKEHDIIDGKTETNKTSQSQVKKEHDIIDGKTENNKTSQSPTSSPKL